MKTSLLVVLGKDGPGIIANVTRILLRLKCNLEDITMTVLKGQLAMMLLVSYEPGKRAAILKEIKKLEKKTGLSTFWQDSLKTKPDTENYNQNLYLVTAIGPDRTGIVYHISN